jgi:hypothetical protein
MQEYVCRGGGRGGGWRVRGRSQGWELRQGPAGKGSATFSAVLDRNWIYGAVVYKTAAANVRREVLHCSLCWPQYDSAAMGALHVLQHTSHMRLHEGSLLTWLSSSSCRVSSSSACLSRRSSLLAKLVRALRCWPADQDELNADIANCYL